MVGIAGQQVLSLLLGRRGKDRPPLPSGAGPGGACG